MPAFRVVVVAVATVVLSYAQPPDALLSGPAAKIV
jgi:hypothetical protein